ncbi:MAG: hypothetical protein ACRELB_18875 [Polyangiaceae bacterium]
MDGIWKALVVSVIVFQLVLTGCVLKLADYAVWLHFNTADGSRGLLDTSPGVEVAWTLGVTFAILLVGNSLAAQHALAVRAGRSKVTPPAA